MKFAEAFAAAALAHLAVLWALGDARLARALASLGLAEPFADDDASAADWGDLCCCQSRPCC